MYRAVAFAQETQLTQAVNDVQTRFYVDDPSVFGDAPSVLSLWEGTDIGESVIMTAKGMDFIDVERGTEDCSGVVQSWVAGTKIAALIDAGQIIALQDNVTEIDGRQTLHEGNDNNPHAVTAEQAGADPAGSAEAVQGALTTHINNTSNPHGTTAAQAGADPAGSAAAVQADVTAHKNSISNPHGVTAGQVGADPTGSAAAVQADLSDHKSKTTNPHAVTASQVGADPAGSAGAVQFDLTNHKSAADNPHSVTTSQIGAMPALAPIVTLTTSATLDLSHAGALLLCGSTSANTITIPADTSVAFPVGTQITLTRTNTGTVTIAVASGVTINSLDSKKAIGGRYAGVTVVKTAANTWYLWGALS